MLVTGSVIIGRREDGKEVGAAGTAGAEPIVGGAATVGDYTDEPDAPPPSVRNVPSIDSGEATYQASSDIELMDPTSTAGGESSNSGEGAR